MYKENNMSKIDDLTGLLTLSAFVEKLEGTYREAQRLVLVVMDLDRFMSFNEKYGHFAGDEWIRVNASLFRDTFGEEAIIGRAGGDEFMAAIPTADLYEIYEKAEYLRQHIQNDGLTLTVDGQSIRPEQSISLGLAAYPANAGDMGGLIEKGKQALYRAKVAGGNQVCFYQETDTLTGLLNYFAAQRSLEESLVQARANGQPVSVFVLDIDRFKEINDEYGHRAGDEVLTRLAKILESNFKEVGQVSRLGGDETAPGLVGRIAGDEFIVVLPGQRADSAFILAEEVRRLVEDSELRVSLGAHNYSLRFRISGGIATFPNDAAERVDLLRKASEALYRSKQIGRNRISLPTNSQMVTKTSHYTQIQLERLADLARKLDKTEAFLLREALDDLLRRYKEAED
jgi:diguanylate cyclase